MDKRIEKIVSNLGDVSSVGAAANDLVIKYEDYEDHVVGLISKIYEHIHDAREVMQELAKLRNLFHLDVPLSLRPSLFRQLNSLVSSLMPNYLEDEHMFHCCFEMMTVFKRLLDNEQQTDNELNELEWDEMEKSVYLLSDWEEQLRFGEPLWCPVDNE